MEAGLRGEYTFSDGLLHTIDGDDDENNKSNYFNVFPTFNLNYQVSEARCCFPMFLGVIITLLTESVSVI